MTAFPDPVVFLLFVSNILMREREADSDFSSSFCSDYYCHPLYATHMVGYGVDPDAPRIPFVTLTIATRPFKPLYEPLWKAGTVVWAAFAGYTREAWSSDVVRDSVREGAARRVMSSSTVRRVLSTTTKRVLRPTMDVDGEWSMSADEVVF